MAVYQEKAIERIKAGLRKTKNTVEKALDVDMAEADTRQVVLLVLSELLGWDQFENITGEYAIKGSYADFVIRKDGDTLAVIEVKRISTALNEKHLRQAKDYAVNEGIEWVILTNGNTWKAYRIVFEDKIPEVKQVFSVRMNDPDVKPAKKAELLYLLSEEASRKNELEDYYERRVALSGKNLASHILSEEVLSKIRTIIRRESGYKVTNAELAQAICANLLSETAIPGDCDTIMRHIEQAERKQTVKSGNSESPSTAICMGADELATQS